MKLSVLIEKLIDAAGTNGDVEVWLYTGDDGTTNTFEAVVDESGELVLKATQLIY